MTILDTETSPATDKTLPDYLGPRLKLIFIGINPGSYSAQVGHYYARPGNLFWWALSNSGLVPKTLGPENDEELLTYKIGLTDVVKRPTNSSGDLTQEEYDEGAKRTVQLIERYQPKVACFIGLLGATAFLGRHVKAGPLSEKIGQTRLFAIPSPSRRNAHYGRDGILKYFQELSHFVSFSS